MRAILCWLLLVVSGLAAESLTCRIPKREIALRKGGTVVLDAELTNHSRSLLEGRLEATVLRSGRKSSTHAGPELVIAPGLFKTQLLLPPPLDPAYGEGFAVRLDFVGKNGAIPLGNHALGHFPLGGEEFVLAVARASRRVSDLDRKRERSLRLETLRSTLEASAWFATTSLSVTVENLPTHPAAWCAYDMVLLDASAFDEVSARQLDALGRWIRAGGSAVIFAEGIVRERQLAFLRALAEPETKLASDAQQRLEPRVNQMFSVGLGRLLLAPIPPATQPLLDSGAWRAAVAWVWKVRPPLIEHIEEHGVWPLRRDSGDQWRAQSGGNLEHWVRNLAIEADRQAVARPRPLPIGWVALLLAGLLILAGPADWYVLGWLRRRRWTWVAFPAICVLCAWVASRMATQHLGPKTRNTSVRLTDLDDANRVLREVAFRLRVPSDDEEWASETTDGLSMAMHSVGRPAEFGRIEPIGELPETRAEWMSPSRVLLRQNLRQWTQNWQQTVSFAERQLPQPDWQDLIALWKKEDGAEKNLSAMRGDFSVFFLAGRGAFTSNGQVVSANSPISAEVAALLGRERAPLSDILESHSPVMVGRDLLGVAPRGPLTILAWRRTAEGLEVLRRHVSDREYASVP